MKTFSDPRPSLIADGAERGLPPRLSHADQPPKTVNQRCRTAPVVPRAKTSNLPWVQDTTDGWDARAPPRARVAVQLPPKGRYRYCRVPADDRVKTSIRPGLSE